MKECSKSISRRLSNSNFITKYFRGDGLDIGGKPDPLILYKELFPLIREVRTWDLEDGDAQYLDSIEDNAFDFIHSSHCLEHLHDPQEGIKNWFRVLKPNGYLIITVPDEDLYEQGEFPSSFNKDHKWTFTIYKESSWSNNSINLIDLVTGLGGRAAIEKIELLDNTYRYGFPRYDQTLTPTTEAGIELIIRKRTKEELINGGIVRHKVKKLDRETRIHLNQYRNDMELLKKSNMVKPPFEDDSDI